MILMLQKRRLNRLKEVFGWELHYFDATEAILSMSSKLCLGSECTGRCMVNVHQICSEPAFLQANRQNRGQNWWLNLVWKQLGPFCTWFLWMNQKGFTRAQHPGTCGRSMYVRYRASSISQFPSTWSLILQFLFNFFRQSYMIPGLWKSCTSRST